MNTLIPSTMQQVVALDQIRRETFLFICSQAARVSDIVMNQGDPQTLLDALGPNAAEALGDYAALYSVLSAKGLADGLQDPAPEIFQVNQGGTVTFIPPIVPEQSGE